MEPINESCKCVFCDNKVLETYKQMRVNIELLEEGYLLDSGAEFFICGDCRGKVWDFFSRNSAGTKGE